MEVMGHDAPLLNFKERFMNTVKRRIKLLEYEHIKESHTSSRSLYYFKFSQDFLTGPDYSGLSSAAKLLYYQFILIALKQKNPIIEVFLEHVVRGIGICLKNFEPNLNEIGTSLKELKASNLIELTLHKSFQYIEEKRIEENRREKEKKPLSVIKSFDFEAAYQFYPRKEGKKTGFEKLSKLITTKDDYDKLVFGIKNYAAHHAREGTEDSYIKMFSSFVTQEIWLDFQTELLTPEQLMNKLIGKEKY